MGAEGVFEDADKQPHGDTTAAPAATPKGKGSRAARKTGAEAENVYATGNTAPGARVLTTESVIAQTESVRELDVAWLYTGVPIVSRDGAPEPGRAGFSATSTSASRGKAKKAVGPMLNARFPALHRKRRERGESKPSLSAVHAQLFGDEGKHDLVERVADLELLCFLATRRVLAARDLRGLCSAVTDRHAGRAASVPPGCRVVLEAVCGADAS